MTEEQIKLNAEKYAELLTAGNKEHYRTLYTAAKESYETGAHSRDDEIKELKEEIESLREQYNTCFDGFMKRGTKMGELMKENVKLRNPWISVKDRLPEKAIGLYKLEEDEQHKMVLFKTANGRSYIGYLDAEEIWRAFTVPYKGACPIDRFTWSRVTHWMPIPELKIEK